MDRMGKFDEKVRIFFLFYFFFIKIPQEIPGAIELH
jgi:hypothetical protein